jgi:hypothetical protein
VRELWDSSEPTVIVKMDLLLFSHYAGKLLTIRDTLITAGTKGWVSQMVFEGFSIIRA